MNVKKQVGVLSMALVVASLVGMKTINATELGNGKGVSAVKGMFVTEKPDVDEFLLSAKQDAKSKEASSDISAQFITNSHDDMIINMYSGIKSKERAIEEYKKTYESIKWVKEYGIEPTSLSLDRIKLLNTGKKYIGIPYVWGGTTPRGFDCSGFTSYVMREAFGVYIGRTTSDQPYSNYLQQIPLSEAQPGDIIFKPGQHTGFFIKDNGSHLLILHSPTEGQRLKIGRYDRGVKVYRPKTIDDSHKLTMPEELKETKEEK